MQQQVVIKSDNTMILTAPVMIPGARDCDYWRGEKPFTVEQVKAFKEAYDDYGFVDDYHAIRDLYSADKSKLKGKALKSFLLTEPTEFTWFDGSVHTYPTGTWMLTSEITDPVAMKQVEDGIITGYSPSIFPRVAAEKIRAVLKEETSSLKASLGGLTKDITDPVPVLVSLVRKPCQHGNKFCKNNVGENMSEDKAQSKLDQIKKILGGKDEPQYALKEDIEGVKEYVDTSLKSALESDEFKTGIKAIFDESIKEALKQPSLKEDGSSEGDDPKKDDEEEDETQTKPSEDKKEEKDDDETKGDTKKPSMKSDSKAQPIHDNDSKPALKSDRAIIMEGMGRDLKGRPQKN